MWALSIPAQPMPQAQTRPGAQKGERGEQDRFLAHGRQADRHLTLPGRLYSSCGRTGERQNDPRRISGLGQADRYGQPRRYPWRSHIRRLSSGTEARSQLSPVWTGEKGKVGTSPKRCCHRWRMGCQCQMSRFPCYLPVYTRARQPYWCRLGVVLLCWLVLQAATAADFPVSVQDGAGRHMSLDRPAERMIALSQGSLDITLARVPGIRAPILYPLHTTSHRRYTA